MQAQGPCWEDAAAFLSDHGFRVALPDLHSNESTLPAALTAGDAVKLVAEVADALQVCAAVMLGAVKSFAYVYTILAHSGRHPAAIALAA